jgi:hypothetical protein
MIGQMRSLSDRDRQATSVNGKEENRAPWRGYNAFYAESPTMPSGSGLEDRSLRVGARRVLERPVV